MVDVEYLKRAPEGGNRYIGSHYSRQQMIAAGNEIERLREALDLALRRLGASEPGDSRAVSDEFVAMAMSLAGNATDESQRIVRAALA